MELRESLVFSKANIKSLEQNPAEGGPSCILEIEAVLTTQLAASLGKDFVYDPRGIAREWKGSWRMEETMRNVELVIGGTRKTGWSCKPALVNSFGISHRKTGEDLTLLLAMRFHLASEDTEQAVLFLKLTNKNEFLFRIEPLQGALFESGTPAHAEEMAGVTQ